MCPGRGGRLPHRWLPASWAMPSGFETKHPCWGWGLRLRAWRGGGVVILGAGRTRHPYGTSPASG